MIDHRRHRQARSTVTGYPAAKLTGSTAICLLTKEQEVTIELNAGPKRELRMNFAGSLVRHLGLQMYSGAVPAIAELIANAYDADASSVKVTIPGDTFRLVGIAGRMARSAHPMVDWSSGARD